MLVKNMKHLFMTIIVAGLSFGCSVKKDLDEMKSTTEEMSETTKSMDETTKEVEEHSAAMRESTAAVLSGGREGFGMSIVLDTWERLLDETKTSGRLLQAATLFSAFEFQQWLGAGTDTEEVRDILMAKAADWFFGRVTPFIDDSHPIDDSFPFGMRMLDDDYKMLAALSIAMSKVHPQQAAQAELNGFKAISFYEIVIEGLRHKDAYERGEQVPHWAELVLENEQNAIYLLQLRHNYFPLLVAGQISPIEEVEQNWFSKLWRGVGYRFSDWDADLSGLNLRQYRTYVDWLRKTTETRVFLQEEYGVELEFNSSILKTLGHMRLVASNPKPFNLRPDQDTDLLDQARFVFVEELSKVVDIPALVRPVDPEDGVDTTEY